MNVPNPPILSEFIPLQGAIVFPKIYLHNRYHLPALEEEMNGRQPLTSLWDI